MRKVNINVAGNASPSERISFVFISLVLSLGRNDSQKQILSTILFLIFKLRKPVIYAFAFAFHIGTVVIAYNRTGTRNVILTALLPVISEFVWLFVLLGSGDRVAFVYAAGLILVSLLIVTVRKLKKYDFKGSLLP